MRKTGIWAVSIIMVLLMGNCARNEQREELTAEGNWLKDHIHEMETTNPVPSNLDDLNPLMAMAENARIIGIGEATHGTSQFFRIWHRVFKALVLNHGYRLIIMEMDLIPYYRMNNYIVKDEGIIDIWFYGPRTREINDLIDWMHQYNLDKADNDKIWLLGSDCRSYREHIDYILEVTKDIDAGLSGKLAGLYAELYAFESGVDYRDEAPEATCRKPGMPSSTNRDRSLPASENGITVFCRGRPRWSFKVRNFMPFPIPRPSGISTWPETSAG
jgi:erythromycin esterase-like protein